MKRLYLDDLREPHQSFDMLGFSVYKEDWTVVRSYKEFTEYITKYGLPDIISFDHDLADEHYTPEEYQDSKDYQEKTGLDCAKWLIEYCMNYIDDDDTTEGLELKLPTYIVHSANPIGRDNIYYMLRNFEEYQNKHNTTGDD